MESVSSAKDFRYKKKSRCKYKKTQRHDLNCYRSCAGQISDASQKHDAEENHTFLLKVNENKPKNTSLRGLLVDSGASFHIMTD